MRFYKLEREIAWSILQHIGLAFSLPQSTVLADAYILICLYHNFTIQQKKGGKINKAQLKVFQNGKLYKIITVAAFHACKMNDIGITLDEIFTSLVAGSQQIEAKYSDNTKVNIANAIELTTNENEKNKNFVMNSNGSVELTDSFKYELVCVYELLLLNSINFSPVIYINPFRYIRSLSKSMVLGSFNICEKVSCFIYMILKSNIFLSTPVNIVVAAATEAAYACSDNQNNFKSSKMSSKVEEWIKACKDQNFSAFENAVSICCSGNF